MAKAKCPKCQGMCTCDIKEKQTMSKTKNLDELGRWKVGMDVYHTCNLRGFVIGKVVRITDGRGGTVYVTFGNPSESAYDINGNERGCGTWSKTYLYPLTIEKKNEIALSIRKEKLRSFKWDDLTVEQASEIVLFMREKGIKI